MANRGEYNGVRILKEETWEALHANPTDGTVFTSTLNMPFTQGGVAKGKQHINFFFSFLESICKK